MKSLNLKINRGPTALDQQGLAWACLQIPGGLGKRRQDSWFPFRPRFPFSLFPASKFQSLSNPSVSGYYL